MAAAQSWRRRSITRSTSRYPARLAGYPGTGSPTCTNAPVDTGRWFRERGSAMSEHARIPPGVDPARPAPARIYDYL